MAVASVKMNERKEPAFVSFQTKGDKYEGKLLAVEKIKVQNGFAKRYTLEQRDGQRIAFLGTAKIDALLSLDDVEHLIFVAYSGDNQAVVRDGKAMKEFVVHVSERPVRRVFVNTEGGQQIATFAEITVSTTGLDVTDADLPPLPDDDDFRR